MTKPLFDVFRDTMMNNPDASRKDQQDEFIEQMKSEPAYLDMLARDYFDRMAAVWTVRSEPTTGSNTFTRTAPSQDKVERMSRPHVAPKPVELVRRSREESAARTVAAFEELKAKVRVVLLDLVLPNGKALRDATGAECAKAGGFYSEVAKHLKPTQVVDRHLSENDLKNICARYYQANKAEAA